MAGWNVELKVLLEDCNAYKNYAFQCSTSFSAVSSQEATAGSAMMISGAALLGAAALVLFVSRKRRAAVLDLNQSEQSGFEMMSDSGVRA
jgi:D-arabinose 1-dehydrogenase-like Zn-dependent alcohol dehydrogenase